MLTSVILLSVFYSNLANLLNVKCYTSEEWHSNDWGVPDIGVKQVQ